MNWLEVRFCTDSVAADRLAEALRPFAQGGSVALEQLGDPQNLDPTAVLPEVYVKIYVSELGDTAEFRLQMLAIASREEVDPPRFTPLADTDWAEAWKANYRPFPIGRRFWIEPSWERQPPPEADRLVLTLDPGMAFGTGLHETTQLCLEALERFLEPGMRVLDLGTGSGILALAAARLGGMSICGIDNDPVAVEAARTNAALNDLTGAIDWRAGTVADADEGSYDLVLVNILAAVIRPMLAEGTLLRTAAPGGIFIFSGIIDRQQAEFIDQLQAAGGELLQVLVRGEWIAVIGRRK